MRTYELLFIMQPELDEEGLRAATEGVQQVIANSGGELVRVHLMGRRRLAYPIRRREAGYYVLVHAKMERSTILEVERHAKLSEDILRHLLVRLDEVQAAALDEAVAQQAAAAEKSAAAEQAAAVPPATDVPALEEGPPDDVVIEDDEAEAADEASDEL